jgi:hypothetical protein
MLDDHLWKMDAVAEPVFCPRCGSSDVTIHQYDVSTVHTTVTVNAVLTCHNMTCTSERVRAPLSRP